MEDEVRNSANITTKDEERNLQEEYFKRLEKFNENNNKTLRIIAICITIVLCVWELGYFLTPYLTRNYSYIKSSGDVNIEGSVNKDVGSDTKISVP